MNELFTQMMKESVEDKSKEMIESAHLHGAALDMTWDESKRTVLYRCVEARFELDAQVKKKGGVAYILYKGILTHTAHHV